MFATVEDCDKPQCKISPTRIVGGSRFFTCPGRPQTKWSCFQGDMWWKNIILSKPWKVSEYIRQVKILPLLRTFLDLNTLPATVRRTEGGGEEEEDGNIEMGEEQECFVIAALRKTVTITIARFSSLSLVWESFSPNGAFSGGVGLLIYCCSMSLFVPNCFHVNGWMRWLFSLYVWLEISLPVASCTGMTTVPLKV